MIMFEIFAIKFDGGKLETMTNLIVDGLASSVKRWKVVFAGDNGKEVRNLEWKSRGKYP